MTPRHCAAWVISTACLVGLTALLPSGASAEVVAVSAGQIQFASKTVGFQTVNQRSAGTGEYALINFIGANGVADLSVPMTVTSSNAALMTVTQVAGGNALGNYWLAVPANAASGSVTVTASATVAGQSYMRARTFSISAAPVVPPAAPPAVPPGTGVSTTIRASTPTLAADQSGCAAIQYYDVGPGHAYSALGQLPWSQLKGCDTVRIFAQPNNQPYHEMLLISAGTNLAPTAPDKFMRVIGMLDPVTGARPIIDASAATQIETLPGKPSRPLQYHDMGNLNPVLYKLGVVMVGPQAGYNYNNGPAGYIGIENLDIRGASYMVPFTNAKTGQPDQFHSFASCLYVEAAAHLVVKNNLLHDCGNGLFINSKNTALVELSQDVLIEANRIYHNSNPPIAGVSNGFSEHNSYTEVRDIIFQYNYFGDVRPGAFGDCLKDRSSGLIVRYNTFASTCGLQLNLEDSTGGQSLIWGDPGYASTYVYGNLFDLAPLPLQGVNLVFYGGDSGTVAHYRQGTLHFYNNTLVIKGDATHGAYPEALLFNLAMPGAVADVQNNVFHTTPATVGLLGKVQAMAIGKGSVNLANNWVSPNAAQYWLGHLTGAVVNGWYSNLGASNQPMFVDANQHDYRPALASPLINGGTTLGNISAGALPRFEPGTNAVRKQDGKMDIGAFEF